MWFRKNGTVIPMSGYHQYLVDLAGKLDTTNMDQIYAKHEAYCAKCGMQFSREALAHLDLFGPGSLFTNLMVVGATREGNDLRSGRCPHCGYDKLRIVSVESGTKQG